MGKPKTQKFNMLTKIYLAIFKPQPCTTSHHADSNRKHVTTILNPNRRLPRTPLQKPVNSDAESLNVTEGIRMITGGDEYVMRHFIAQVSAPSPP